jgi:hypothetical protein
MIANVRKRIARREGVGSADETIHESIRRVIPVQNGG